MPILKYQWTKHFYCLSRTDIENYNSTFLRKTALACFAAEIIQFYFYAVQTKWRQLQTLYELYLSLVFKIIGKSIHALHLGPVREQMSIRSSSVKY